MIQMGNVYEICFYGGLTLAIVFFIVSVILFIVLKIPKVMGELTGKTAKKNIKEMKEGGLTKDSISKKEQAKYYNQGSGKITVREGISTAKRKENRDDTTDLLKPAGKEVKDDATEVLEYKPDNAGADEDTTGVLTATEEVMGEDTTDVLAAAEEMTDVSAENDRTTDVSAGEDDATEVLAGDSDATEVLAGDSDETTVLSGNMSMDKNTRKCKVEFNVVVVNTEESL